MKTLKQEETYSRDYRDLEHLLEERVLVRQCTH